MTKYEDQVRIIRILEYTGTREFVERSLINRGVVKQKETPNGIIREAILGEFAELIESGDEE